MKDINLIPRQHFKDKSKPKVRSVYFIFVLAVAAALVYSYISPMLYIEKLQAESEAYNESLVEYNSVQSKIKTLQNEKQTMEKRLTILQEISKTEIKPTEVLETIKKVMPKDVSLTSLEFNSGAVTMTAVAKTASSIAEFYIELTKIEGFKDVALSPVTKDVDYGFSISFNMNTGSDSGAATKNQ